MNSRECYFSEWNRYPLCNADSEVLKNTFNVDVSNKLMASSVQHSVISGSASITCSKVV